MRELSDYSMVMDNCASAYDRMTNGLISKPNTLFSAVEEVFNDKYVCKDTFDAYGCIEDIEDILEETDDIEELKEQIRNYFNSSEIKGEDKPQYLGYSDKECINCGRLRVEKYSDGTEICEKCNFDQNKKEYV